MFTSEWDRFARETYKAWHLDGRSDHVFVGDITEVAVADIPRHDVLAAGFPCQPFSLAGVSKKNSLGRDHGFEDPTQGTLFFNIREIAREVRPPILLLENVKNLLSHDRGKTWRVISDELDRIDYAVFHRVIDARAWVPQHRERVLIVAVDRQRFPWIEDGGFEIPEPPVGSHVLRSVLEADSVPEKYTLSERLWQYLQDYRAKHEAKGNGFGFTQVGPDDVARTMSARYHKDGSEILVGQPASEHGRPRRLTPREAQRLMGLDPASLGLVDGRTLDIVVSDTQAYRQFGNAVVPAVVNHVAAAIFSHLEVHVGDWTSVGDAVAEPVSV